MARSSSCSSPLLRFSGLMIGHGREPVAGPLEGELRAGELVLLRGANGSGKTTLLRSLLGLLPTLGGEIHRDPGLRISYVPHLHSLDLGFPLTCGEVVATGLVPGLPRGERQAQVVRALAELGLEALRRQAFARLSFGQRQRILVARALCAQATLLAMDEPTAGVDADSSEVIWQTLRRLGHEGRCVLAITHDHFVAPRFADRQLLIDAGGLRAIPPQPALAAENRP